MKKKKWQNLRVKNDADSQNSGQKSDEEKKLLANTKSERKL
jgi:hypothetical protein